MNNRRENEWMLGFLAGIADKPSRNGLAYKAGLTEGLEQAIEHGKVRYWNGVANGCLYGVIASAIVVAVTITIVISIIGG